MIKGAVKSGKTSTSDGTILQDLLHGVEIRDIKNLITSNGTTTELFRTDWGLLPDNVDHIIHVVFRPNAVSAWHMHEHRTDYIFVTEGTIRIALYDGRGNSPSHNKVNVINSSRMRPVIVKIPNGVWHGFENLEQTHSSFINYANRAYSYEEPDEWRLPSDTLEIPYSFK